MKITDLLKTEGVSLKQAVTNKDAAIDLMVDLHDKAGNLYDRNEFRNAIMIRESAGSTAVGMGIACKEQCCKTGRYCCHYSAGRSGLQVSRRNTQQSFVYDRRTGRRCQYAY